MIPQCSRLVAYGIAVAASGMAWVLTYFFQNLLDTKYFFFYYPAIFVVAWLEGLGPALLTLATSLVTIAVFFVGSAFSFQTLAQLSLFGGVCTGMATIVESQRRLQLRALQATSRFTRMAQIIPDLFWIFDLETRANAYVNEYALEAMGYTPEQIRDFGPDMIERLLHPDDRVTLEKIFQQLDRAKEGESETFTVRIRRPDGSYRVLRNRATVFSRGDEGGAKEIFGIAHDITQDVQALATSEERFRILVQSVHEYAIYMLDPEGIVISWNVGAERIKGYRAEEVIGKHFSLFYTPEAIKAGKPKQLLERALREGHVQQEDQRVRKDGTIFQADVVITTLFDEKGQLRGFSKVTRDISDRKRAEEDLRRKDEELHQSRKIEAIGRLAGGVAHDFNNLLTGIQGIASELRDAPQPPPTYKEDLQELIKATERAASLTRQLLAFGRQQIAAPVVLNLNSVVHEMQKMLQRLIGEDIELQWALSPNLRNVRVDPGQVEQILVNLVLNSRDAMPRGGKITIETTNAELTEEYKSQHHFDVRPGPYTLLMVSDTGSGMDEETQRHIFEPFYSTKGTDGTGLGLATVYGIVKQNGGHIFVYSNPGAGTTFKIYLPSVTDVLSARATPASSKLSGHETILVVEDEALVRRVAVRTLQKNGYNVLEAANGNEALEVLNSYTNPVDLLITDVIMPGMNGRQLAELIQASRPSVQVLYTSGYTQNIIVNRGMLKPGINFIEKTFTGEQLLERVRQVLDKRSTVA